MFKNWTKVFTTDCKIIILENGSAVYPIFKNGQTSLINYAQEKKLKVLKNQQIKNIKKVKVFLRDPLERFISGVHTVIELEKISNVGEFLKNVECFKTYNRHFIPQFYWLLHLSKYCKGVVELAAINELYDLIPNRNKPFVNALDKHRKKQILSINNKAYIDIDRSLMKKYMERNIKLEKIIKEFKNALS